MRGGASRRRGYTLRRRARRAWALRGRRGLLGRGRSARGLRSTETDVSVCRHSRCRKSCVENARACNGASEDLASDPADVAVPSDEHTRGRWNRLRRGERARRNNRSVYVHRKRRVRVRSGHMVPGTIAKVERRAAIIALAGKVEGGHRVHNGGEARMESSTTAAKLEEGRTAATNRRALDPADSSLGRVAGGHTSSRSGIREIRTA